LVVKQGCRDIDKLAPGIPRAFRGNQLIGEQDLVTNFSADGAFLDGEENDFGRRLAGVNFLGKGEKMADDGAR
jgi:hypothetical protein